MLEIEDRLRCAAEQALVLWGVESQITMLIEECAELIVALAKLKRNTNGSTFKDVISECVDVEFLITQIKILSEPLHEKDWEQEREYKFNKLEERLGGIK